MDKKLSKTKLANDLKGIAEFAGLEIGGLENDELQVVNLHGT